MNAFPVLGTSEWNYFRMKLLCVRESSLSHFAQVIQHNQNVERIKSLKEQLSEAQGSLSQLKEDLEDDITRASADFKKAADLHQEVNNSSNQQ